VIYNILVEGGNKMKNIKLIICSLLAIFLIMMLPSASALEARAANMPNNYSFGNLDKNIKMLKEKYEGDNVEPTFIIIYSFLIMLLKILRLIDVGIVSILFLILTGIIGNRTA
jgi:hypothetical protein